MELIPYVFGSTFYVQFLKLFWFTRMAFLWYVGHIFFLHYALCMTLLPQTRLSYKKNKGSPCNKQAITPFNWLVFKKTTG